MLSPQQSTPASAIIGHVTTMSSESISSASIDREPARIPLLKDDGSNFAAWKVRTETILRVKGLYGAIDGTETDPVKLQIAQVQLVFTVEDGPLHVIVDAKDPKEMWDRLCVRYEVKSIRKPVFLVRDLFRTTLDDKKPLMPQIHNLRQIARVLESLKQPIPKSLIAMAIINSLPPSYTVVQTILMAEDPGPPSINEVITRILVEESRREQLGIQSEIATNKRARDGGRERRGSPVRKEVCDTCGKRHGGECRLKSPGQNGGTSGTTNTSSQGRRNT
ncbi:MAG TPA: hypothetical protein VGO47_01640 [Chlamydiales bacterium]|jgi:hypothetical protein|nr:hypothetical protein [Chlamydiales bacterium]